MNHRLECASVVPTVAVANRKTRSPKERTQILMRGTMIHAPGDIRSEQLPDPIITVGTDAIIRTGATCVCGLDL